MDKSDRTRDQWIEQYLRGELTPEEQIEFETRFIRDQQLLEDVEVAAAFRLKQAYAADSAKRRAFNRWWMPVMVAASLMAVALLIMLRPAEAPVAHGNVQIVTLGLYRGGGEEARRLETSGAERVVFEVPVEGGMATQRLRWLSHPAGGSLEIDDLRDSGEGYVTFEVDSLFLAPGLHRFEIGEDDHRQEFSFNVAP